MLTSGGLDLQDALLAGVGLEGVGQGRGDGEEGPLPVGGRGGGSAGGQRAIDDALVAAPDRGAVGGGVEGGHGGRQERGEGLRGRRDGAREGRAGGGRRQGGAAQTGGGRRARGGSRQRASVVSRRAGGGVVFGQLGRHAGWRHQHQALQRRPVPVVIGLALWTARGSTGAGTAALPLGLAVSSVSGRRFVTKRAHRQWAAGNGGARPDWLQSEAVEPNTLSPTNEAARLPSPVAPGLRCSSAPSPSPIPAAPRSPPPFYARLLAPASAVCRPAHGRLASPCRLQLSHDRRGLSSSSDGAPPQPPEECELLASPPALSLECLRAPRPHARARPPPASWQAESRRSF